MHVFLMQKTVLNILGYIPFMSVHFHDTESHFHDTESHFTN
jgi:hypothetical protein